MELLAGNCLLGHHRDLEDSERLRVVAAVYRPPGPYDLVFVVLPRQYPVFCLGHCHGVLCLDQFTEVLAERWSV